MPPEAYYVNIRHFGGFFMKIRIDDDYDKNDLEKFNINGGSTISNNNEQNKDNLNVNIIDTTFKEVEQDSNDYNYDEDYEAYYSTYNDVEKNEDDSDISGKIYVTSRLANKNKTRISSAKINLYKLNGVSPKLVDNKYTDNDGKVIFDNLKKGSYRVIAIVDRKYFEKPTYTPWNEVTIDSETKEKSIEVINKIKSM